MKTIKLSDLDNGNINLGQYGEWIKFRYNKQSDFIVLDTNKGYQLIFYKGKLVNRYNFKSKKLITIDIDKADSIIWLDSGKLLMQTKEQFISYLLEDGEFVYENVELRYNYHDINLNELYFLNSDFDFVCKHISDKNLFIIYGKGRNLNGIRSWTRRICLRIWRLNHHISTKNIKTSSGLLLNEFYSNDPYSLYCNMIVSDDSKYLAIQAIGPPHAVYVFDLGNNSNLYPIIHDDNAMLRIYNHTEVLKRQFFFNNDELFFMPMKQYGSLNHNFRVYNLKERKIIDVLFDEYKIDGLDEIDEFIIDQKNSIIFFLVNGNLKCFDFDILVKNKSLKQIEVSYTNSIEKIQSMSILNKDNTLLLINQKEDLIKVSYSFANNNVVRDSSF